MDLGVRDITRETYAASLELAGAVLVASGAPPAQAREVLRRFRAHDEATLEAQYAVKDDESKFLATSREAAAQLEKLFESDEIRAE